MENGKNKLMMPFQGMSEGEMNVAKLEKAWEENTSVQKGL